MSIERKIRQSQARRAFRVRRRIARESTLPRVSVFRSLNHMYAQLIDDAGHRTVASCSTLELKAEGNKTEIAHQIGKELARRAQEQGITKAVFDRGRFLYHGRVKALAEGLREGGLNV